MPWISLTCPGPRSIPNRTTTPPGNSLGCARRELAKRAPWPLRNASCLRSDQAPRQWVSPERRAGVPENQSVGEAGAPGQFQMAHVLTPATPQPLPFIGTLKNSVRERHCAAIYNQISADDSNSVLSIVRRRIASRYIVSGPSCSM